jgi:hypothetical protein
MFEQYQSLRDKLMGILNDSDLSFQPSDANPSLGALCREIGEIQIAYIQSFQTLKTDFSYRPIKVADTGYISRFSQSFDHLNVSRL